MSVQKLIEIMQRTVHSDGHADRWHVKDIYGAGFEGAVADAARLHLVTDGETVVRLHIATLRTG